MKWACGCNFWLVQTTAVRVFGGRTRGHYRKMSHAEPQRQGLSQTSASDQITNVGYREPCIVYNKDFSSAFVEKMWIRDGQYLPTEQLGLFPRIRIVNYPNACMTLLLLICFLTYSCLWVVVAKILGTWDWLSDILKGSELVRNR